MGVTPGHLLGMDPSVMLPILVWLTVVVYPVLGVNTKAASFSVNCNCQCSDLTFRDKWGRVQGNCKAADNTGAVWCYVDSTHSSTCRDKVYSKRFSRQGKAWSYEACSTPSRHSSQCSGGFGGGGGGYGGGGNICRGNNCGGGFGGGSGCSGSHCGGGGFSGGSISNCRGNSCNVGSNTGYNTGCSGSSCPFTSGSSGGGLNGHHGGSGGGSGSGCNTLACILQARKKNRGRG